jgi:hypothetical protein
MYKEPLNWIMHEREPLNWIMHERDAFLYKTDPNSRIQNQIQTETKEKLSLVSQTT